MSKMFGIGVRVNFDEPFTFTDEWVDGIYKSLEHNMVIMSADVFFREDKCEVAFLLGVRTFIDESPEAANDLANEAIDKAFSDADGRAHSEERTVTKNEVLQPA